MAKINSRDKGKRTERALCKILTERFGKPFSRVVGSGNRWSQVELSQAGKDTLVGDIVCPEGFLWSIECKGGYDDVTFDSILSAKGNKTFKSFLSQAEADAERSGKQALICWYRHGTWWAFAGVMDMPGHEGEWGDYVSVNGYIGLHLSELLLYKNPWFFAPFHATRA